MVGIYANEIKKINLHYMHIKYAWEYSESSFYNNTKL